MREKNRRVLVIDDNEDIHADFQKILSPSLLARDSDLADLEATLFDKGERSETTTLLPRSDLYEVISAFQGQEGWEIVQQAVRDGRPFALAFVDMRIPPGWDGLETVVKLWEVDPDLQIVICTAYADYTWDEISSQVGRTDKLLILKKPFDVVEVRQIAAALATKWEAQRHARVKMQELEEMVAERVRDIERAREELEWANAELEAARRDAETANRAKSEFLANMSHEIRTPMTAVLGFAESLLEDDISEDERRASVETVLENGRYLLTIINEILDLSKIEAQKLAIERIPSSPFTLLGSVAVLMRARARQRGLDFGIDYETPIPETIHGDPTRIRQILLNLVGNAVKFTPSGGSIRIGVRFEQTDGEGTLGLQVRDTGVGMDEETRSRLFRRYEQADVSTARLHGGTGLGLAISRALVELMGGEMSVTSDPGAGTSFFVSIPTGPADDATLLDSPPESVASAGEPVLTSTPSVRIDGARVLVAEDNVVNQCLIRRIVEKAGARVELATNGRDAVELAREAASDGAPFDAVLLDMQMPILDGYEAARELRSGGYDHPIVALTAHAMSGDREKCIEAGCDEFATKPIDRARLVRVISELRRE